MMGFLDRIKDIFSNEYGENNILDAIRKASGCTKERLMNAFKPKEPC